jgi:hypothetical protein
MNSSLKQDSGEMSQHRRRCRKLAAPLFGASSLLFAVFPKKDTTWERAKVPVLLYSPADHVIGKIKKDFLGGMDGENLDSFFGFFHIF